MFLASLDGEAILRQIKKKDIACTFLQINFKNILHYDSPSGVVKKIHPLELFGSQYSQSRHFLGEYWRLIHKQSASPLLKSSIRLSYSISNVFKYLNEN